MKHCALLVGIALCMTAPAGAAYAAPSKSSGDFEETHAYWSNGKLPATFHLSITISVDGDLMTYRGVNSTDPEHPHIAEWSGKLDGQLYPFDGGYFDHMKLLKMGPNEYLIEKYRDGALVVGEFWNYLPEEDKWVRHGVVARAAADGTSKAYIEEFSRVK